jgi:L-threonylcarbamoyladenylate synthase
MIDRADARAFARCIQAGGVVLFPADTVYGLACDPGSSRAVQRLYALKGRRSEKPAAVMFFALEPALACLSELGPRTRGALRALMPGPVTALLANPKRRFALASGASAATIGLRVPAWPEPLRAFEEIPVPVLQSSANRSGEPDARRLEQVPRALRLGTDLVLDAGELPGVASSIVDLSGYELARTWRIVREGALPAERVEAALA